MVKKRPQKYSLKPANPAKSAMTMGTNLRVSFKNTTEVARTIRGMSLERANTFLRNVIKRKECVPFKKFNGGIGHTAQAKHWKKVQGRWPEKSCRYLIDLLHNCETNAQFKGLDLERMLVKYVVVQKARRIRRRIYRAHGRINPFMSTPSHIEMILEEKPLDVKIPRDVRAQGLARRRRIDVRLNHVRKVAGIPAGASVKKRNFQETVKSVKTVNKRSRLTRKAKKVAAAKKAQAARLGLAPAKRGGKNKQALKAKKSASKKTVRAKKPSTTAVGTGEGKDYKTPKGTRSVAVLGKMVPKTKPPHISDKVWELFLKECQALRAKLNPTSPLARKLKLQSA